MVDDFNPAESLVTFVFLRVMSGVCVCAPDGLNDKMKSAFLNILFTIMPVMKLQIKKYFYYIKMWSCDVLAFLFQFLQSRC